MAVLNHVAVTVRDVDASAPWYQALFGVDPVLDEHTDAGFRHVVWAFEDGTISASTNTTSRWRGDSPSSRRASTMSVSAVRTARSWKPGSRAWSELGVEHGGIVDAHYGSGLSFREPTASRWSSSPHLRDSRAGAADTLD